MKKMKLFLTATAVMLSVILTAQIPITVDITGTTSSSASIPISTMPNGTRSSTSQQIYTAQEIQNGGLAAGTDMMIEQIQIGIYNRTASVLNIEGIGDIEVWLGLTAKSSFSANTDWIPASSLTQVYTHAGNVTNAPASWPSSVPMGATVWVTMDFSDNPFLYTAGSNLVFGFFEGLCSPATSTTSFTSYGPPMGSTYKSIYHSSTDAATPVTAFSPSSSCTTCATSCGLANNVIKLIGTTDGTTPIIAITTKPAATTTVTEGSISDNLSIAATVTQGATLSYQWYSNTTNSNSGGTLISGATGTSFAIPTTLTATASPYYYYCTVSATGGATPVTSNVATVTVTPSSDVNTITQSKMTVYPNPATSQLYITLDTQETVTYTLYNMVGQVMMSGTVQNDVILNIASLSKGIYMVRAGLHTAKIVVSDKLLQLLKMVLIT
jgi:hypothetical protein